MSVGNRIDRDVAKQNGLVRSHAYAVLQVVKVLDQCMVQLKNPWSKKRWMVTLKLMFKATIMKLLRINKKGRYSVDDDLNWTDELEGKLNYRRKQASQVDDGIQTCR